MELRAPSQSGHPVHRKLEGAPSSRAIPPRSINSTETPCTRLLLRKKPVNVFLYLEKTRKIKLETGSSIRRLGNIWPAITRPKSAGICRKTCPRREIPRGPGTFPKSLPLDRDPRQPSPKFLEINSYLGLFYLLSHNFYHTVSLTRRVNRE